MTRETVAFETPARRAMSEWLLACHHGPHVVNLCAARHPARTVIGCNSATVTGCSNATVTAYGQCTGEVPACQGATCSWRLLGHLQIEKRPGMNGDQLGQIGRAHHIRLARKKVEAVVAQATYAPHSSPMLLAGAAEYSVSLPPSPRSIRSCGFARVRYLRGSGQSAATARTSPRPEAELPQCFRHRC